MTAHEPEPPDGEEGDLESFLLGHSRVTRGEASMAVYPVYGDPPRYYCRTYAPDGRALCAVDRSGGGWVEADDGGGNAVWVVAGASLAPATAAAVVRAFSSGAPLPLPLVVGLVYDSGWGEFVNWPGPRPEVREPGGLAVVLGDTLDESPERSGVWNALTVVTVSTPEWLAHVASHPLPSLHSLRVEAAAGTARLQDVLDAHPHLSLLWLDGEAALKLPYLSAPQLRRLWLGFEMDPDTTGDGEDGTLIDPANRARGLAVVARWKLAGDIAIAVEAPEQLALWEPRFPEDPS